MRGEGFELLPAVDVAGRRAVQVVEGPSDPVEVALRWVAEGADRLHLVDLDRAYGRGSDLPYLIDLIAQLPVPVQLSGGLDTPDAVDAALASGAARINLAATALREPRWVAELIAEHGDRIAVGIDLLDGEVAPRGTSERLGPLTAILEEIERTVGPESFTPQAIVLADAARDGRRTGVDAEMYARARATFPRSRIIASGGIAGPEDLRALRRLGVGGAVLGSSLYHGTLTLAEAKEAVR